MKLSWRGARCGAMAKAPGGSWFFPPLFHVYDGGIFCISSECMRIAEIATLYESVPPKFYGGTERIVSYLTEELVKLGHEVTLFASGDSVTKAHLVPSSELALRLDERSIDPA